MTVEDGVAKGQERDLELCAGVCRIESEAAGTAMKFGTAAEPAIGAAGWRPSPVSALAVRMVVAGDPGPIGVRRSRAMDE